MSTVINTNVKAMISTSALVQNGRSMRSTMESLSTGSRINQASDDAAGLSVRENMTAQINGLNAAVRNANDGISMLQTADGALNEVTEMLQRMRELGTLAQNDTYSTAQRVAMNDEFTQLQAEIDRIAENTQWNSMNLLDGTGGNWGGGRSSRSKWVRTRNRRSRWRCLGWTRVHWASARCRLARWRMRKRR
jgi:flagellin